MNNSRSNNHDDNDNHNDGNNDDHNNNNDTRYSREKRAKGSLQLSCFLTEGLFGYSR